MKLICIHPRTLLMQNDTAFRQWKLSSNLPHPNLVRFCRILSGWSVFLNSHFSLINYVNFHDVIQIYIETYLFQVEYRSLFTLSDSQKGGGNWECKDHNLSFRLN